jgi:hypothetical protein
MGRWASTPRLAFFAQAFLYLCSALAHGTDRSTRTGSGWRYVRDYLEAARMADPGQKPSKVRQAKLIFTRLFHRQAVVPL